MATTIHLIRTNGQHTMHVKLATFKSIKKACKYATNALGVHLWPIIKAEDDFESVDGWASLMHAPDRDFMTIYLVRDDN